MIIVFPMLTDESISPNIMPGVCKALEKFILIYELDALMKMTGMKILNVTGGLLAGAIGSGAFVAKTKREDFDILDEAGANNDPGPWEPDASIGTKHSLQQHVNQWGKDVVKYTLGSQQVKAIERTKQLAINKDKRERALARDKAKWDAATAASKISGNELNWKKYEEDKPWAAVKTVFDTMKGIRDVGTVNLDMPRNDSLSLEPSYLKVDTATGSKIIGIKVIPVPVKSREGYTLAELLAADQSLDFFHKLVAKYARKIIRAFWAICRGLHVPFLSDRVVSGDPVKDIVWASSFHKRYVFCLLNIADISSDFFKSAGGIHKLHSLGWNSFVVADEVNKRAVFCMKEFHGLCSTVPYQFIYSSLGKEHMQVYDNLEDVKKAASPFFRVSKNIRQVFGESEAYESLQNYLNRI